MGTTPPAVTKPKLSAIKNMLMNSVVLIGDESYQQFKAKFEMAVEHGKMT